jgi:hypothetical protein
MSKILYITLVLFLAACATRKTAVVQTGTSQAMTARTTARTTAVDSSLAILSEVYDRDSLTMQWSFALVTDSTGRPLYRAKIVNGCRSWARGTRQDTHTTATLSDTSATVTADTTAMQTSRTETRTKAKRPPDMIILLAAILAATVVLTVIKSRKL